MAKYIGKFSGEEIDNCIANPNFSVVESSDIPSAFRANVYHILGEQTSLSIVLEEIQQTERSNYYVIDFISGTTPTTLSIPETVRWEGNNEIEIESNTQYVICINASNMMAVWGGTSL